MPVEWSGAFLPPWISRSPLDIWALHWAWAIQRLALLRGFLFRGVMTFPWNPKCHFGAVTKATPVTHPWWSKRNSYLANKTVTVQSLLIHDTVADSATSCVCIPEKWFSVSSSVNDIVGVNGHWGISKTLWSRTKISHVNSSLIRGDCHAHITILISAHALPCHQHPLLKGAQALEKKQNIIRNH